MAASVAFLHQAEYEAALNEYEAEAKRQHDLLDEEYLAAGDESSKRGRGAPESVTAVRQRQLSLRRKLLSGQGAAKFHGRGMDNSAVASWLSTQDPQPRTLGWADPRTSFRLEASAAQQQATQQRRRNILSPLLRSNSLVARQSPGASQRVFHMRGMVDSILPIYNPDTLPRRAWDLLIMALVVWTAVTVPLSVSFGMPRGVEWDVLNYTVTALFFVDLFVNFRTAFYNHKGELVRDSAAIAANYMKFWFWIDLFGTIPFDSIILWTGALNSDGANSAELAALGFLKAPRLLRLGRLLRFLDSFKNAKIFRIAQLFMAMILLSHWLACVWYMMYRFGGSDRAADWAFEEANNTGTGGNMISYYVVTYYYSFLLLVGDNLTAYNNYERTFYILVLVAGTFFYSAIVGQMATLVATMNVAVNRHGQKLLMVQDALRYAGVPDEYSEKVQKYFEYLQQRSHPGSEGMQFLQDLPTSLHLSLCQFLHLRSLHKVPLFKDCEQGFMNALAVRIRMISLSPSEVIFRVGDVGKEMYVIKKGCVAVTSPSHTMWGLLQPGEIFGEVALLSTGKRTANCTALGFVDLAVLAGPDLQVVMRDYPVSAAVIHARAAERARSLQTKSKMWLEVSDDEDDFHDCEPEFGRGDQRLRGTQDDDEEETSAASPDEPGEDGDASSVTASSSSRSGSRSSRNSSNGGSGGGTGRSSPKLDSGGVKGLAAGTGKAGKGPAGSDSGGGAAAAAAAAPLLRTAETSGLGQASASGSGSDANLFVLPGAAPESGLKHPAGPCGPSVAHGSWGSGGGGGGRPGSAGQQGSGSGTGLAGRPGSPGTSPFVSQPPGAAHGGSAGAALSGEQRGGDAVRTGTSLLGPSSRSLNSLARSGSPRVPALHLDYPPPDDGGLISPVGSVPMTNSEVNVAAAGVAALQTPSGAHAHRPPSAALAAGSLAPSAPSLLRPPSLHARTSSASSSRGRQAGPPEAAATSAAPEPSSPSFASRLPPPPLPLMLPGNPIDPSQPHPGTATRPIHPMAGLPRPGAPASLLSRASADLSFSGDMTPSPLPSPPPPGLRARAGEGRPPSATRRGLPRKTDSSLGFRTAAMRRASSSSMELPAAAFVGGGAAGGGSISGGAGTGGGCCGGGGAGSTAAVSSRPFDAAAVAAAVAAAAGGSFTVGANRRSIWVPEPGLRGHDGGTPPEPAEFTPTQDADEIVWLAARRSRQSLDAGTYRRQQQPGPHAPPAPHHHHHHHHSKHHHHHHHQQSRLPRQSHASHRSARSSDAASVEEIAGAAAPGPGNLDSTPVASRDTSPETHQHQHRLASARGVPPGNAPGPIAPSAAAAAAVNAGGHLAHGRVPPSFLPRIARRRTTQTEGHVRPSTPPPELPAGTAQSASTAAAAAAVADAIGADQYWGDAAAAALATLRPAQNAAAAAAGSRGAQTDGGNAAGGNPVTGRPAGSAGAIGGSDPSGGADSHGPAAQRVPVPIGEATEHPAAAAPAAPSGQGSESLPTASLEPAGTRPAALTGLSGTPAAFALSAAVIASHRRRGSASDLDQHPGGGAGSSTAAAAAAVAAPSHSSRASHRRPSCLKRSSAGYSMSGPAVPDSPSGGSPAASPVATATGTAPAAATTISLPSGAAILRLTRRGSGANIIAAPYVGGAQGTPGSVGTPAAAAGSPSPPGGSTAAAAAAVVTAATAGGGGSDSSPGSAASPTHQYHSLPTRRPSRLSMAAGGNGGGHHMIDDDEDPGSGANAGEQLEWISSRPLVRHYRRGSVESIVEEDLAALAPGPPGAAYRRGASGPCVGGGGAVPATPSGAAAAGVFASSGAPVSVRRFQRMSTEGALHSGGRGGDGEEYTTSNVPSRRSSLGGIPARRSSQSTISLGPRSGRHSASGIPPLPPPPPPPDGVFVPRASWNSLLLALSRLSWLESSLQQLTDLVTQQDEALVRLEERAKRADTLARAADHAAASSVLGIVEPSMLEAATAGGAALAAGRAGAQSISGATAAAAAAGGGSGARAGLVGAAGAQAQPQGPARSGLPRSESMERPATARLRTTVRNMAMASRLKSSLTMRTTRATTGGTVDGSEEAPPAVSEASNPFADVLAPSAIAPATASAGGSSSGGGITASGTSGGATAVAQRSTSGSASTPAFRRPSMPPRLAQSGLPAAATAWNT